MKQARHQLSMMIALIILMLTPQMSAAAPNRHPYQEPAVPTAPGLELKLTYQDGVYTVSAQPNFSTEAPQLLLGSQITIKVPHAQDVDRFTAVEIASADAGVEWLVTSRVDAPTENQAADYLSFTLEPLADATQQTYEWSADQEIELFRFENGGTCLGTAALMSNTDSFYLPVAAGGFNSAYTDPVNSFIVVTKGDSDVHDIYSGIDEGTVADCGARRVELTERIFLPLIAN